MNNTGFVILLLLALSTSSLGATREYHYVQLEKTWTDAQSYCRQNFADLATIETEEDWKSVQTLTESAPHFLWIGLYDDINGWKWSVDNTYLYKDGTTGFGEWFSFITDSSSGVDRCVVIVTGTLYDKQCDLLLKSVCYDESTNKYIPVTVPMSWFSAQSYCRETYTDLTSMRSLQEKEEIMKVIDQSPWWIGLYRVSWTWSDQSNSALRIWGPTEPNGPGIEFCAGADVEGWIDLRCYLPFPFICSALKTYDFYPYEPVPRMILFKVVLKAEESVNMNDALVQESVLKNMEKIIKHHGVQQKFRLTWREQPSGNVFHKMEV